ncbi:hypothetical protein BDN72DRAFT_849593 [Pluteus cervinus]|uniref:Uncharacterized protein n=1 Tax=Pluteus cervinus TaxID=181527 RepID=A0ACD3A7A0_9AGAR|nr:hypothetical protein BDN72DRAFT_849593 [Pluteus cervinus]
MNLEPPSQTTPSQGPCASDQEKMPYVFLVIDNHAGMTDPQWEWLKRTVPPQVSPYRECALNNEIWQVMTGERWDTHEKREKKAHSYDKSPVQSIFRVKEEKRVVDLLKEISRTSTHSLENIARYIIADVSAKYNVWPQDAPSTYIVFTTRAQELNDFRLRFQHTVPDWMRSTPKGHLLTITFVNPTGGNVSLDFAASKTNPGPVFQDNPNKMLVSATREVDTAPLQENTTDSGEGEEDSGSAHDVFLENLWSDQQGQRSKGSLLFSECRPM